MEDRQFKFDSIEEALQDFAQGKPIIVADDEDRENEGDVIISAEKVTPELIKVISSVVSVKKNDVLIEEPKI